MKVKDIISKLESSQEFKSWRMANREAYLAHLFCMVEDEPGTWQVGYYDRKADTITSFDLTDTGIKALPPEEVFKREGTGVKELKEEAIRIDIGDALSIAEKLQKTKYPGDIPVKRIVVLQTLADGQVYNITYVTKNFKTLNIKISSETGKIMDEQLAPIFSFDKRETDSAKE